MPGYEGLYEVSSAGRVRSLGFSVRARAGATAFRPGRVLVQSENSRGYRQVSLAGKGRAKSFAVHALVAAAFIGPRFDGQEVRHLDGEPANNTLDNLAYGSAKENAADCIAHGRRHRGHKHPMARLTEDQVRIIKDPARGLSGRTLALLFGVTESHIGNIQAGLTWKHVRAA